VLSPQLPYEILFLDKVAQSLPHGSKGLKVSPHHNALMLFPDENAPFNRGFRPLPQQKNRLFVQ
jgi:hypothetical protein